MFQKSSLSWQLPSERKKLCKVLDKQPLASIVTYNRFADLNDDDYGDSGKEKKTKKFKVSNKILKKHEEKTSEKKRLKRYQPANANDPPVIDNVRPALASTQTQAFNAQPVVASIQHIDASVQPVPASASAASDQPAAANDQPAAAIYQSVKASIEPIASNVKLIASSPQPVVASIGTYNRYADLGDGDNGDSWKIEMEDEKTEKFKVNKKRMKKHEKNPRREKKHHQENRKQKFTPLSNFTSEMSVSIFPSHTEKETKVLLGGHTVPRKRKCNNCGLKKRCHICPLNCKAAGKHCRVCKKKNHFPKGQNCKKSKMDKSKIQAKGKIFYGCQTLREFFRCKNYHLKAVPVPFDRMTREKQKNFKEAADKKAPLCKIMLNKIDSAILRLEEVKKYNSTSITTKFFLHNYVLFNLQDFLCRTLNDSTILHSKTPLGSEHSEDNKLVIENYVKLEDISNKKADGIHVPTKKMNENEENIAYYSKQMIRRGWCSTDNDIIPQFDGLQDISSSSSSLSSEDTFKMEEDNHDIESLCDEETMIGILQLDGSEERPMKESFNGLAGLISDGVVIPFLINFFRSFENHWGLFVKHELCKKPKCKTGRRCLFCHLRSSTLRSNRIKQKRSIKTMEMESQLDKFPDEITFLNDFPIVISKMLEEISSFDLDFRNSFVGGDLECGNCNKRFSTGLFETIHLEIDDTCSGSIRGLQDIATKLEEKCARNHQDMSSKCKLMKLDLENKKMLVATIEGCHQVKFSERIWFMDSNYETLSFSSVDSEKTVKTTFKFKGNFYTSYNGSLPELTNVSELQNVNVILFAKESLPCREEDLNQFIFNRNALDSFTKEAYKLTNRKKYNEMKEKRKEVDTIRDKTEKRREMHQNVDTVRDKTEKRKEMHQNVDTV